MPLPLLPLLFMAGSIGANAMGARKADQALAHAQNAERLRQKKFDDESFGLNAASRERFDDVPADIETRGTDLAALFGEQSNEAPVEAIATAPPTSSNIVMSRENDALARAKAQTDARAVNMGRLQSFGDLLGDASRGQGRDAGQLGLIGSMRRGSQAVLPLELQAAQGKGAGWRLLGDILGAGSSLSMPGGMFGGMFGGAGMASSIRPMPNPRY